MGGGSSAWGRNTAAYDRQVDDIVILHAGATLSAPALILRPWCVEDIAALVDVFRDPALRRWTSSAVENEGDAMRWVRDQERGWAAGNRFGFAVLEAQPESSRGQLVGHMVRKEVASGKPSAEVGYWTAAHARGRRVAPRALETVTRWAFDVLGGRRAGASGTPAPGRQPGLVPRGAQERVRPRHSLVRGAALFPPRGSSAHPAQGCLRSLR